MNALRIALMMSALTVFGISLFSHVEHRGMGYLLGSVGFDCFAVLFLLAAFLIVVLAKKRDHPN
jgi:hypothetical protein